MILRPICLPAMLAATCSAGLLHANDKIDFDRQIRPIFQAHCFKCHGPNEQKGGLRLDYRTYAERGGDSGESLLNSDPSQNLLYQLVTASDPKDRMPQEADPLPPQLISRLKLWIEQGAHWPSEAENPPGSHWTDWADRIEDWAESYYDPFQPWLNILIVLFLVFEFARLVHKRMDGPQGRLGAWAMRMNQCPRHVFGYGMLFLIIANLFYLRSKDLAKQRLDQAFRNQSLDHFPNMVNFYLYGDPPKPLKPHRPPSIGGTFYRGNNERSSKLYNNGIYRTATFHLSLEDARGKILQHGDAIEPGRWTIRLLAERSPLATSRLFTPQVWKHYFLSSYEDKISGDPSRLHPFKTIEPGEKWEATYTVPAPTKDKPSQGTVYLHWAKLGPDKAIRQERNHYGIGYHLMVKDGQLSDQSRLWMGNLLPWGPGYAIPPKPDKVQPQDWFSTEPIPEIPKGWDRTTDPKLLGTDEHIRHPKKVNDAPSPAAP